MYNGIRTRERKNKFKFSFPTKFEMLQEEETVTNGIIQKQTVMKIIDMSADPNIKYTDFEVANLQAAGIDVKKMPAISMKPSIDKITADAETATEVLEYADHIRSLTPKQQENATQVSTKTE